jgi:hypothetical protein
VDSLCLIDWSANYKAFQAKTLRLIDWFDNSFQNFGPQKLLKFTKQILKYSWKIVDVELLF